MPPIGGPPLPDGSSAGLGPSDFRAAADATSRRLKIRRARAGPFRRRRGGFGAARAGRRIADRAVQRRLAVRAAFGVCQAAEGAGPPIRTQAGRRLAPPGPPVIDVSGPPAGKVLLVGWPRVSTDQIAGAISRTAKASASAIDPQALLVGTEAGNRAMRPSPDQSPRQDEGGGDRDDDDRGDEPGEFAGAGADHGDLGDGAGADRQRRRGSGRRGRRRGPGRRSLPPGPRRTAPAATRSRDGRCRRRS